jgi:triosephosphate isomerase (TIM)
MMRKKIVAGNWKMNLNVTEGSALIAAILKGLPVLEAGKQVVLAPPFLHTTSAVTQVAGTAFVSIAGQNCHQEKSGAFTGEISAGMLKAAGATSVILGHSERREYSGETNALLAAKTNAALEAGLEVIFCCGEPLDIRDAGTQNDYVSRQLQEGIFHLDAVQMQRIVIAYEPIWAIGTGRTASAEQAQDMHRHIREVVATQYGADTAANTSILYGGSCKPSNAAELFASPDVDGGLIGGAALKAEDFLGIIEAMIAAQ